MGLVTAASAIGVGGVHEDRDASLGAEALGEPDVVAVAVGEHDAADVVDGATDGIQLAGEVGVHAGQPGIDEGDALGRDDQVGGDDVVADAVQ